MKTGHISSQARHVVHDQSTSGSMIGPGSFCLKSAILITSRRFTLICFGESGFPVLNAGHALEQRPHSVQV